LKQKTKEIVKTATCCFRVCQEACLCNAPIIFQHINARKVASIQGDTEFHALPESIIPFKKKLLHRYNNFQQESTKATKNDDFFLLVDSGFFHCTQIISQ
jgi:hypothetical protein